MGNQEIFCTKTAVNKVLTALMVLAIDDVPDNLTRYDAEAFCATRVATIRWRCQRAQWW